MLNSVLSYLVTAVLSALGGWLLKMIHIWMQDQAQSASDAAATAAATKALQDAKTKQELDDAAKGISNNF